MKPRPLLIADIPRYVYVINNILTLPFLIGCALFFNTHYPDKPSLMLPILVGTVGYFIFLSRNYIHARDKIDAIGELVRTLDNDQRTEVVMHCLERVIETRRGDGFSLEFENNKTNKTYKLVFGKSEGFDKIIQKMSGQDVDGVTAIDHGGNLSNLNNGVKR